MNNIDLLEKSLNTYRQVITIDHYSYLIGDLDLFCRDVLYREDWLKLVEESFGTYDAFIFELKQLYEVQNESPNKFKSKKVQDWIDYDFIKSNAHYFNRYLKYLSKKGISINVLQTDVLNILNGCGDPSQTGSFLHKGLVYGEVQSGKTANYAGVINCAYDLGYKLVIVLAGITNKLRDQTEGRLIDSVTGRKNHHSVGVGNIEFSSRLDRVRLISGDVSINQYETLSDVVRETDSLLFVVKKNPHSLNNLIRLIVDLKGNSETFINSCLVIDDECDHASLRSMSRKEYEAYIENNDAGEYQNEEDILKAINARIRIILSLMHRCSYIGYTATPYSVILQRSLDIEREYLINKVCYSIDENTDLFPEDFITLIRPGRGYLGLSQIFSDSDCIGKEIVHQAKTNEIGEEYYKNKFEDFLIQIYILNFRNNSNQIFDNISNYIIKEKFSIWMIHPDHRVEIINDVSQTIFDIYCAFKKDLTNLAESRKLMDKMNLKLNKFKRKSIKILGLLSYDIDEDIYIFPEEIERNILRKILEQIQFVILHSSTVRPTFPHLNEVDYEQPECPKIQIVIGGNILSRGTTFPGLLACSITREATRADSLYQMARWNGYRIGYEDLLRISMLESIATNFKVVYKIDETLRRDLYSLKNEYADLRPEDWELSVLNLIRRYESKSGRRSSFTLTGKERIRSAVKSNIMRSGQTIFLNDYRIENIDSNFDRTRTWVNVLNNLYKNKYEEDYRQKILNYTEEYYSRVFLGVNPNLIKEYFQDYESGKVLNSGELESCFNDASIKFNVVIKSLKNVVSLRDDLQTLHYLRDSDTFENVPISIVGRSLLKDLGNKDIIRITSILDSDNERHIDLINSEERKLEFSKASTIDQKSLMKEYRKSDNSCLIILYFVNNSKNSGELIYDLDDNQILAIPYVILPKFKISESVLTRG